MFFYVFISVLCILILYIIYCYKKIHYVFDTCGLKYLPGVPIFGNTLKSTFLRRHFIYDLQEVYDAFPDEKYVGFIDGMKPVILVRDPELMKIITIKHFDYFQNRKHFFPLRLDPLVGRNVLELEGEEWKSLRNQLSPAFTASRLRHMLPIMIHVSKNVVNSLKGNSSKEIDLTESMYRYAGDSLASAAFGFDQEHGGEVDSVFSKLGESLYLNFWRRVLIFISLQFPKLGEFIRVATGLILFPRSIHDSVRKAIIEALKYRMANNLTIRDYMDILLKIFNEGKTIDDLAGQFLFSYGASMESSSGTLRFTFHELALNPQIQERLYQDIIAHEKLGEMTLESLNGLKYLDCVLKETSRRWSAAVMMDRVCTKPYILPPHNEGSFTYLVSPGDTIFNVVNQIHMDPKYHPNPKVFDPERFSAENKTNIQSFTFMPFGVGPRGCLGVRFAILQLKVMIYQMVLNFKVVKCAKTTDPIELQPDELNMKAVGGTWVRLELRQ